MASTASLGSLSVALANAITYLTRSLIEFYSATQIIKLQLALEANLTAQFETSWVPSEPLRGSGRRCLTLSPSCAPPRPIYHACKSAGIEWSKWMTALGGVEFDLFIDPGCVSLRFGSWGSSKGGKFFTVWAQEVPEPSPRTPSPIMGKTVAQQIMLADGDEDEQLFAMLSNEIREPTWVTPIASQFPYVPAPPRSPSPISVISAVSSHSRTSSCSSLSSSGFSFFSRATDDSYGSATTVSLSSSISSCSISIDDDEKPQLKLSRRERARQAKVFIDTSKKEITNYDGGKTTVLTGGVMLGAVPKARPAVSSAQKKSAGSSFASNWRSGRA